MRGPEGGHGAPVVVGVDGSPPSTAALLLAVRDAVADGSPLLVLAASERLGHHDRTCTCRLPGGALCVDTAEEVLAAADETVTGELARLRGRLTRWSTELRFGSATQALTEAATDARMLSVGVRGLRRPDEALIGATASALVAQAPVPVMLAHPGDADPAPGPRFRSQVVAAVAGDRRDREVLRVAGEWAERHHAQLHVVHSLAGHADGRDRDRVAGHRAANRQARLVQPDRPRGGLVTTLTYRSAQDAVPALSTEASLVVMGASGGSAPEGGDGGPAGRSTGRSVVSRLHCPVLVLPSRSGLLPGVP